MGTPWGPIQGEAIRREMTPNAGASEHAKAAGGQADLDTQELRELERAEYYAEQDAASSPPARLGVIARLRAFLRRSP